MVSRHDHKTWTSDNWKSTRDMVRWVVLHAAPCIRKSLRLENTEGSLQSGMPGSNSETRGRFCDSLGSNIVIQYSAGPILPLIAELLHGSTWSGWVIRCIPGSRRYFRRRCSFPRRPKFPHSHYWNRSFSHSLKTWKWTPTSSLASTIITSEHHWTTLVSFGN
jgi:hypothetical protein